MGFTFTQSPPENRQSQKTHHHHHPKRVHCSFQLVKLMLMPVTLISFYLFISCSIVWASGSETLQNNNVHMQHIKRQTDRPQANDIFAKLKHSQGHIHDDHNELYLQGSNSIFTLPDYSNILKLSSESSSFGKTKRRPTGSFNKQQRQKSTFSQTVQENHGIGMSCKNEKGEAVSWYVLYKLPRLASSSDPELQEGSKYYYLIPGNISWTPSEFPINSNRSMLASTLEAFWNNDPGKKDLSYVIYNDQAPSIPAIVKNGHTKGLVLTSPGGGLWLQHSCPHFPDISMKNFTASYPPGGLINGQMFLCMTFTNTSVIDEIGSILKYTKPFIYNYSIPSSMDSLLPELTKVARKNATQRNAPWFSIFNMQTATTTTGTASLSRTLDLKVFAKGPKFHDEIYSTWIAPYYGASLDVQSWLNGPHPFASNYTSENNSVYNVLTKTLPGHNFTSTDDHSKWAVGTTPDKPLVCIGDLNRMKPQKTRGGVTICLQDKNIWSAFNSLVVSTQPCNFTERIFKVQIPLFKKKHRKIPTTPIIHLTKLHFAP